MGPFFRVFTWPTALLLDGTDKKQEKEAAAIHTPSSNSASLVIKSVKTMTVWTDWIGTELKERNCHDTSVPTQGKLGER
jgi:hypothetical protein